MPAGDSLNDVLEIDYPRTSNEPTHIELHRCASGIEAISYIGARRRNYQILIAGDDYRYSAGRIAFTPSVSRYENHFFLSNIDRKSTTRRTATLDPKGNLVFTFNTLETGTNWFVPGANSSSRRVIFERIR